ncbi:MAG TPA: hypothetical protein VLA82_02970 [Actinomycetota bacterium]|nr:hypothetical protein [Actinomycetota bacterium]
MFARYFVELPLDADHVVSILTRDPHTWMPGLAEAANRRGDDLLAEVGFGEQPRISRTVAIELAPVQQMPSKAVVPIRWKAAGAAGLFPELDADIEVAPLGVRTQLALSARYVPPLGVLGRAVDRALLARVAEATIKDFLDRVADAIVALDRAEAISSPPAG